MSKNKINAVTLGAWLFAAITAPLAQIGAGAPWLYVLAVGAICGVLCWCIHSLSGGDCCTAKWYCLVQLLFLAIATGAITNWTADCWPTGSTFPVVPLVLLALAAASAWDGGIRASRTGGVVFWFVALLFVIILAAGVKNQRTEWLRPEWELGDGRLIFVFLIPAVATFLPREKGKGYGITFLAVLFFGLAATLLTIGALSPKVAKGMAFAFYEYSKSLSLLGVAERFEAFVSVALTMGYFALLSLLLSGAYHLTETLGKGSGRYGILFCVAAAAICIGFYPIGTQIWLPMCAVLLWGVLPFGVHAVEKIKKSKNGEKSY